MRIDSREVWRDILRDVLEKLPVWMLRRFSEMTPERRDGTLKDKLRCDAEAILAWAVEGLNDYLCGGGSGRARRGDACHRRLPA